MSWMTTVSKKQLNQEYYSFMFNRFFEALFIQLMANRYIPFTSNMSQDRTSRLARLPTAAVTHEGSSTGDST